MNRGLIVKSQCPELSLLGSSQADDVVKLKLALEALDRGETEFDVGLGGTVLRFLALRVSRLKGQFHLKAHSQLMQRPQQELEKLLSQLGCEVSLYESGLKIKSHGWHLLGDGVYIRGDKSSQFASAVLLSAWEFEQPLFIQVQGKLVSKGYLEMTIKMLQQLGMEVNFHENELSVPAGQFLKVKEYKVEPDMSSTFAVSSFAAVSGSATFTNFPKESLQPDSVFPKFLTDLGAHVEWAQEQVLKVSAAKAGLKGAEFYLSDCPDVFPVLASLCFLAEGNSVLRGGAHLKYKESNRLREMAHLLGKLGRQISLLDDGIRISGDVPEASQALPLDFDPKNDHRLAMAAALLNYAGFKINIKEPGVVSKSFPEFWNVIGESH